MKKKNKRLVAMTVITAFCGFLAISTIPNKKYIKTSAETQSYSFTITPQYTENPSDPAFPVSKARYEAENSGVYLNGYFYNNNYFIYSGTMYINTVASSSDTALRQDVNNALFIFQINPYLVNIETELTINLSTQFSNMNFTDFNNSIVQIQYDFIRTTDDLQSYMNLQTPNVYNIYQEITNVSNNFHYTESYSYKTLDLNNPDDSYNEGQTPQTLQKIWYVNKEQTVRIDPNNTTYLLFFIQPRAINSSYVQNNGNKMLVNGLGLDIKKSYAPYTPYTSTFTGIYVIPTGGDIEVIDVGSLLFQILSMPFTFISVAFDLTIFPGTPYQINFSNLFLTLIAVMIFIFILKLLLAVAKGSAGA